MIQAKDLDHCEEIDANGQAWGRMTPVKDPSLRQEVDSRSSIGDPVRRVKSALKVFGDVILSREDEALFPLHRAIQYGDLESLHRALETTSRSDLNQVDFDGRSPLDLAGLSGQRKLFDKLRSHGAQSAKVPLFILDFKTDQIRAPNVKDYHLLVQSHPDISLL